MDAVLRDQQRNPEEAFGQQAGQGRGSAGRGMAEVDGAEAVVAVPVEGERAQGALQLVGEHEVVGHGGGVHGAACARRAAGGFEDAHGDLGAEGRVEPAALAGEVGQAVQPFGEGLAVVVAVRADGGGELLEVAEEAPPVTASVGVPVVLGGPQRSGADPLHLGRELDPALFHLLGAAAEGVDVEVVLCEPAHEPVAPQPGLTRRIRITTVRKQSDPHERTPDLPCGRPPLVRRLTAGRR